MKSLFDKLNTIHPLFVAIPLSLWGILLRVKHRASSSLWFDEIWQINVLDCPFFEFVRALPQKDFSSYLNGDYFLTYPFFHLFGDNKWGLAIPHMIATLIGFWLFYLICRELLKTSVGMIIAFSIFSFNATLINHALEIRPYAVLPVLNLGVFYVTMKLLPHDFKMSWKRTFWIGLFFILTIWFYMYGVVILFVHAIYFLATLKNKDMFKTAFVQLSKFGGIVLLIAMPLWLYSIFGEHLTYETRGFESTFQFITDPTVSVFGFLKDVLCNFIGHKYLYVLILGAFFGTILPHSKRMEHIKFFGILILLPFAVILLMDIVGNYWLLQRQFIWLMPFFALYLAMSWEATIEFVQQRVLKLKDIK